MTGNEAVHVVRFLDSFGPAFDELCLVRAIGNQAHDRTVALAKEWCEAHGKRFKFAEYFNQGPPAPELGPGFPVNDDNPRTWPHVDDFAAARNLAWSLASGAWQFWADLDDILFEGAADKIRAHVMADNQDGYFFRYALRTSGENVLRERLFRRGVVTWELPIHERASRFAPHPLGKEWRIIGDESVIFCHQPDATRPRDPQRNIRILSQGLKYQNEFPWYLANEWFYRYQWAEQMHEPAQQKEAREQCLYWAELANHTHIAPEQKLGLYLNLAHIYAGQDSDRALDLIWEALRVAFWRKDSWGHLAELELRRGKPDRAELATELMMAFRRGSAGVIPSSNRFAGWEGLTLRGRALRANGKAERALAEEKAVFAKQGARISLLHATRGRPAQAVETRANFFKAAALPLGVEHIFAIDADDTASREALAHYRHVIIDPPGGCVRAWNAAAAESTGQILVQLSDDWLPAIQWDELIYEALTKAAEKNGQTLASAPLVLAISDNHRTDALLCCAILTRARYQAQGHLFAPEYFGVFSDNEFTVRAYADGVVVPAHHIVFDHRHPIFAGLPMAEWDETHRRQNAPERYREGLEIYNRRNPAYALKPALGLR